MIPGRIRAKLATWNTRLWFGLSKARRIQDIDVRILLPGSEGNVIFDKVSAALALIATHSPIRLRHIRRDLRGIWITETAGNQAEYDWAERLCLLDRGYLLRPEFTPAHVAASVIHEATHARLARRGFGYQPERRARVEGVCYRAELRFASRLPDQESLVEQIQRDLGRDPIAWSAAASAERAEGKLRELSVPGWLIRRIIRQPVPANKPLERPGMNASRPTEGGSAGRSAPGR